MTVEKLKQIRHSVVNFFPVQLMILNFKKNQVLLFFWLLFFAIITGSFGTGIGLHYLWLDPEYMHKVSFLSMVIMGVCFGVFTLSYFITSYILDSHRFAFLGTIKNPFSHYCLNNSFIPILFLIVYLIKFVGFQFQVGFEDRWQIFVQAMGFLLGLVTNVSVVFFYFRKTNKDLIMNLAFSVDKKLKERRINAVQILKRIDRAKKKKYKITSYINFKLKIKKVDENQEYDKKQLVKIIDQHHINALIVEVFVFVTIIIIGLYRDYPVFQIPAAASGFLFGGFIIMFTGAFSYWLRGWAITGLILILFFYNFLVKNDILDEKYQAFGLNYNTEQAEYSLKVIDSLSNKDNFMKDTAATVAILEKWKQNFPEGVKPHMVFLCASGGGQRAAAWTMRTLQYVDSTLNGDLMRHTTLMTGASGGLIGCSFYRELQLMQQEQAINRFSKEYYDQITADILNPMIFSIVVSDFFLRFQKQQIGQHEYFKGRGFAFEQQLNRNTNYVMDKSIMDYYEVEKNAKTPMIFMAPVIINDARKLYISSQHISYMNNASPSFREIIPTRDKGIEFRRFFAKQEADSLRFTSALRMSATFPYITPNVELPSIPEMEIMDAGLSDNYGVSEALRFIFVFRKWIEENTSGVVLISIRDTEYNPEINRKAKQTFWSRLFNPIGSLYKNFDHNQDLNNYTDIEYMSEWLGTDLNFISFQYVPKPRDWSILKEKNVDYKKLEDSYRKERASLSWHLTTREKQNIWRTIKEDYNVEQLNKLKRIFGKE